MKKLSFLVVAVFLSTSVFAQGFEYGIKAGLNLAKQTKVDDLKMRAGIYAGVFAESVINDFVGVQGELLYSMMGAKMKMNGYDTVDKTDYIVLPILLKLYVADRKSVV